MISLEDVVRLSHKTARKMIDDPWLAQDIAQNTIVSLLGHDVPSGGYVMRSVRNKFIDYHRVMSISIEEVELTEDVPCKEEVEEIVIRKETAREVRQIVAMLPRVYQDVLEDLLSGLSYKEIARKRGIPLGTMKSRFDWAKRRFKKLWEEQYGKEAQDPCVCSLRGRSQGGGEGTRRH